MGQPGFRVRNMILWCEGLTEIWLVDVPQDRWPAGQALGGHLGSKGIGAIPTGEMRD